jgi:hypothetical protein
MTSAIELACPTCGAPLSFPAHLAGQSGPCYACTALVTVPAPSASRARAPEVHATPAQARAASDIAAEASSWNIQVLGSRVVQTGTDVAPGENGSILGEARFLMGQGIRIDRAQAIKLATPGGDAFFVFIPWSADLALGHELGSLLPGTLPTNLRLARGPFGPISRPTFLGDRGEEDPVARLAQSNAALHDGITWHWRHNRRELGIDWGLQAIPFDETRSLHLMQTGRASARDFRLAWFLGRRLAFVQFLRTCAAEPSLAGSRPSPRFEPTPIASYFWDDFRG